MSITIDAGDVDGDVNVDDLVYVDADIDDALQSGGKAPSGDGLE